MSGHSKWHSIKHKKGIADAKRGKVFTKHAKLIAISARAGGDPEMNPALRTAIANAKADNVPNANIEKAVKKGSGGDKDATQYFEIVYEGYGPAGTAMLVEVITDNKNRALTNIKTAMTKNGGNLGEAGSVGWMFDRRGVIFANAKGKNAEEAELEIIDAGAEDFSQENDSYEIITPDTDLMSVRDKLESFGFQVQKAELSYLPKNPLKIESPQDAGKILKLIDLLEDDEDVSNVHSNFDIPDEIMEAME
jgi:YebC/PmpR family DNA-binding regulatory protein